MLPHFCSLSVKATVSECTLNVHWGEHSLGLTIDEVCSFRSLLSGHNQAGAAVYSGGYVEDRAVMMFQDQ